MTKINISKGQKLYELHAEIMNKLPKLPLPKWEQLTEERKEAWETLAQKIYDYMEYGE